MSCSNKFKTGDKVVRKYPCLDAAIRVGMIVGKEYTVVGYDKTFNRLMLKELPYPSGGLS